MAVGRGQNQYECRWESSYSDAMLLICNAISGHRRVMAVSYQHVVELWMWSLLRTSLARIPETSPQPRLATCLERVRRGRGSAVSFPSPAYHSCCSIVV